MWTKDEVKKLRVALDLTQVEFAAILGCRQQTVSEWEKGLYEPANAYGKLLDQLQRGNDQFVSLDKNETSPAKVAVSVSQAFAVAKTAQLFDEIETQSESESYSEPEQRPFDPAID